MAENKDKKVLNVPNIRFKEFKEEWEKCRLDKVATIVGGGTPDTNNSVFWNGSIQWFTPSEVGKNKYISHSIRKISEEGLKKSSAKLLPIGTILLSSRATIGECSINTIECTTNQGFESLIINQDNYNEFFFYLIQTKRKELIRKSCGSTFLEISSNEIKKINITKPSRKEQEKIASFLSLIDERIATQNKIIEELECLKKEITKRLFSQKANKYNRLDTLFVKGKAGGTPTSTNKEYYNGNIPFLSINDITTQGKYIYYTEKYITQEGLDNSSAWIVPKGCLIISMYASVGLVAINCIPISTSQAMFSIQLKDENLIDYLYYYLSYFRYRHIHKYLETGTQSNINADIVRSILIPDYGYDMNIKIANSMKSIDDKIKNEVLILNQYTFQKQHLLRQMFI